MVPNWMDGNGNITKDKFNSNEKQILVHLVQAHENRNEKQIIDLDQEKAQLKEGDYYKQYTISYGTRIRIEDTEYKARDYFDTIYLTKDSCNYDYNFKSILGPGVNYGITADRFMPVGSDVQSNFATNFIMENIT